MNWFRKSKASPKSFGAGVPDLLKVYAGNTLLVNHTPLLLLIRQQVGVPDSHWKALYVSLFESFAAFVQQTPASEAHHHANAGGLLTHCLEVTLKALTLRRGVLLPHGASAEELAQKQDVWTYATATAALLHDIGKPLCDQRIAIFDATGQPLGDWDAYTGPIRPPATFYQVNFRRGRRYRLHSRLPPLLVHHILPPVGLRWMSADPNVFEAWLATISGGDHELAGELGKIIRSADSLSVATSLAGEEVTRLAVNAPKPLAERMATALRFLVDQGKLPINKPGAAGWVDDDSLWLVSKRALDTLREHMLVEGQSGIPNRNDRLMDELQAVGLLSANGDKAIWNASIRAGTWNTSFTLLRVKLTRLWPELEARPARFEGSITPEGAAGIESTASNSAAVSPISTNEPTPAATGSPPAIDPAVVSQPAMPKLSASTNAPPSSPLHQPIFSTVQRPDEDQYGLPLPPMATDFPQAVPDQSTGAADSNESIQQNDGFIENPAYEQTLAQSEFLTWLRDGIVTGKLKTNAVDARVHYVADGLFLVSPAVFRDFAGMEGWEPAQKKLLKLKPKLHLKTTKGTNVWTYRVQGENRAISLLKGVVIPNPLETLGLTIPRINPLLHKVEEESSTVTES